MGQKTTSSLRMARMYKHYGKTDLDTRKCEKCVNCQFIKRGESHRMCICYGRDIEWNPQATACGLFNQPYLGIKPRPRPLVEMYKDTAIPSEPQQNFEQSSLF